MIDLWPDMLTAARNLQPEHLMRLGITADNALAAGGLGAVKITPLSFRGEGTVMLADMRNSQIVVDHKEIPGFMAPMIMGYPDE